MLHHNKPIRKSVNMSFNGVDDVPGGAPSPIDFLRTMSKTGISPLLEETEGATETGDGEGQGGVGDTRQRHQDPPARERPSVSHNGQSVEAQ